MNNCDLIIKNANLFQAGTARLVDLVIDAGKVIELAAAGNLQASLYDNVQQTVDAKGQLLTSGLVDCHTHLIYGGHRSHEFEWRLQGQTYLQIAQKGGGILSTVAATRLASFDELYQAAAARLKMMISQGVLTVEIKSGYGLDLETELKMLRVAKQLEKNFGITIKTTYLGAHTLPPEYAERGDQYIEYICQEVLPVIKAEQLADAVDVFCESIGFNLAQTEKLLSSATTLGFDIKCHAEQLSNLGCSQLAASMGALSCDHIEYIDEAAIEMMAQHQSVAVLLPGAFYFLKETTKPPIELFRKYQVPMAVATDANPGSSPTTNLPLMMNMACVLFGLTVEEAWLAVTNHAAQALALKSPIIAAGQPASFVLWPFKQPVDLVYHFGQQTLPTVFIAGKQQSFTK